LLCFDRKWTGVGGWDGIHLKIHLSPTGIIATDCIGWMQREADREAGYDE